MVISAPKTVEEADDYCTQLESRLLKIENEETYNFIRDTLSKSRGGPFWIGATLSRPTNGRGIPKRLLSVYQILL